MVEQSTIAYRNVLNNVFNLQWAPLNRAQGQEVGLHEIEIGGRMIS